MKTLHLNLKKKWFDMIKSGEKTEEYREISDYYITRLFDFKKSDKSYHKTVGEVFSFYHGLFGSALEAARHLVGQKFVVSKKIKTVTFSNGYAKDRPQFAIELRKLWIRTGDPEWGAEPGKYYFVLKLGSVLPRAGKEVKWKK